MQNSQYKQINFLSSDGIPITADFYSVNNSKNLILCCHRSHCNRAEYRPIAPKLNSLGFSCLAIDQRSGMNVFGEINETKRVAKESNLPTGYLDAKIDIDSSIDYAYELNNFKPIILWGSSYSASLSLLCSVNNQKIKGLILFSPGNYLKKVKLSEEVTNLKIPIFATSTKSEIGTVQEIFKNIDKKNLFHFKPNFNGFHGSKALWPQTNDHKYYWVELMNFLKLF